MRVQGERLHAPVHETLAATGRQARPPPPDPPLDRAERAPLAHGGDHAHVLPLPEVHLLTRTRRSIPHRVQVWVDLIQVIQAHAVPPRHNVQGLRLLGHCVGRPDRHGPVAVQVGGVLHHDVCAPQLQPVCTVFLCKTLHRIPRQRAHFALVHPDSAALDLWRHDHGVDVLRPLQLEADLKLLVLRAPPWRPLNHLSVDIALQRQRAVRVERRPHHRGVAARLVHGGLGQHRALGEGVGLIHHRNRRVLAVRVPNLSPRVKRLKRRVKRHVEVLALPHRHHPAVRTPHHRREAVRLERIPPAPGARHLEIDLGLRPHHLDRSAHLGVHTRAHAAPHARRPEAEPERQPRRGAGHRRDGVLLRGSKGDLAAVKKSDKTRGVG
mmetsp:Transcript_41394/g.96010  ORF Transcript_41394/g.96010 Transcript_41394/m.96010 type:complete len:381 (+) Transcript_41394:189-1331(+)